MEINNKDEDNIMMMIATVASGYVNEGLSEMRKKEECLDVSEAATFLGITMWVTAKKEIEVLRKTAETL